MLTSTLKADNDRIAAGLFQPSTTSNLFRGWLGAFVALLLTLSAAIFVVNAYSKRSPVTNAAKADVASAPLPVLQGASRGREKLHSKLSSQPEADHMRRRIGSRFLNEGREVSVQTGTLMVGNSRQTIRIIRSQYDDEERVSIAIDGKPFLVWNAREGATADGKLAANTDRSLIEKIVLDSPDQFVLAQVRGASYSVVARDARPFEAGGLDSYEGPVWDVVQVREPENGGVNKPFSTWRLFYLNAATGLIEKIVSQEAGETVLAEFSGWVEQNGEKNPTHIIWSRNKQTIMELVVDNLSYSSKEQ